MHIRNQTEQVKRQIQNPKTITKDFNIDEKAMKKQWLMLANQIALSTGKNEFVIDDINREAIKAMWSCLVLKEPCTIKMNGKERTMDPDKGFLLLGNVGTGKSALLSSFAIFLRRHMRGFKIFQSYEITEHFSEKGNVSKFTTNENGYPGKPYNLGIDEIGFEPTESLNYGARQQVIKTILHQRYYLWTTEGILTHGTTNKTLPELEERYGEAILDRLKEMCNIVILTGDSRR